MGGRLSSFPTPNHNDFASPGHVREQGPKESMQFRGKAFKSQFHGPTDPRSAMSHVPEAFVFAREVISRSPALVRVRRDLGDLRQLQKSIGKAERKQSSYDLLNHLPNRGRADSMVQIYLDNIDTIYGFIHVPSFRIEYEAFWRDPRAGSPFFVATLLLMIASVECLVQGKPNLYIADSPIPREHACRSVEACEAWFSRQSQKHTTLGYFQVHCLLLVAKEVNGIKAKKRWVEAGTLLRTAVAAGMHRDTDLMQKTVSAFDREMRKRIWSFIVEQDLKASLDRGMPAVSLEYPSDCGVPSNFHDEDFDLSTIDMPRSRPDGELTKMSYLRYSTQSRSLRAKLTTQLNQPSSRLSCEDVLAYTQQIEHHLALLPEWPESRGVSGAALTSFDQSIILLRIQLEQFLLVIHASAVRQAASETAASFSKTAFLTASRSILRKLHDLSNTGRNFLLLYRQEILRIFVSVGQLGTSQSSSSSTSNNNNKREVILGTTTPTPTQAEIDQLRPLLDVANTALSLFEDRLMRSGNLQWTFTFAVYDLLRNQLPVAMQKEMPSGCDRIYQLFKYITENQEPGFAMKAATHQGESLEGGGAKESQARHDAAAINERGETESPKPPSVFGEGQQQQLQLQQQVRAIGTPVATDATGLAGGSQSFYAGSGAGGTGVIGTDVADLLDWNFDDWMLYNEPLWPASLGATEVTTNNAFSG